MDRTRLATPERGFVLDAKRRLEQRAASSTLSTSGSLRGYRVTTRARARSRRLSNCEQESQRPDRAIDRCRAYAVLMLVQLETPNVLGRRGVRSTAKKRGEAPDMTNVVVLRARSQAPH